MARQRNSAGEMIIQFNLSKIVSPLVTIAQSSNHVWSVYIPHRSSAAEIIMHLDWLKIDGEMSQ